MTRFFLIFGFILLNLHLFAQNDDFEKVLRSFIEHDTNNDSASYYDNFKLYVVEIESYNEDSGEICFSMSYRLQTLEMNDFLNRQEYYIDIDDRRIWVVANKPNDWIKSQLGLSLPTKYERIDILQQMYPQIQNVFINYKPFILHACGNVIKGYFDYQINDWDDTLPVRYPKR